ncbi:MAG TPA: glycosyltransferase family 4 protein [Candidatus Nitrosotenuis sp.]|jgi:glycosyltransferase involved in cell wall biosynthesis|nr:glycosyltransferase family 4 protein [Candidatus Nitrosotenuis sp.]
MPHDPRLLDPRRVQFAIVSMEGPDLYCLVGGLAVRATELAGALADLGYQTDFFFVGDPRLPAEERDPLRPLTYHRWCQWISASHPTGVYSGEEAKVHDLTQSLPGHLVEQVIAPAARAGRTTVVMAEEWQTVPLVIRLARLVAERGLSQRAIIFWNANNLFGFHGIDWGSLLQACQITTVSRYMKHRMWSWGLNPLVIPNGIPRRYTRPVSQPEVRSLRRLYPHLLLAKVARYDPDKRWLMAIDAVAELKRRGRRPRFIVRGGQEPHRGEVIARASMHELSWSEVHLPPNSPPEVILKELPRHQGDVLELCFHVPEEFLRPLYAASHAVLANSGHEPFGLVGLEVMGCGGVAFTGSTGEDYAQTFINSVVIDSDDPREMSGYIEDILQFPEISHRLRVQAQVTASHYLWDLVIQELCRKLRFVGLVKGVIL